MEPKTVIAAGMQRSMSTWQHRVAARLLREHRGAVDLGYLPGEKFADADTGGWQIVKCHQWAPEWRRLIEDGRAVVIGTYRDLRDACASWFRFHRKDPADRQALNQLINYLLSNDAAWSSQPRVLMQRYESLVSDPVAGVREIAGFLRIEATEGEARIVADSARFEVMQRHNAHHVHDGRVGLGGTQLPGSSRRLIERRAGRWLAERGYADCDDVFPAGLFADRRTLQARCAASGEHAIDRDALVIPIFGGHALCYCDPDDIDMTPCLKRDGLWEPWVSMAVARFFEGRTGHLRVLNAGACVGYYTLLCALHGAQVEAVEAHPRLAGLLERTLRANDIDWCNVRWGAVAGEDCESVGFFIPETNGLARAARNESRRQWSVPAWSVDSITAKWDRCDLIVMDIEGAEVDAWRGMQRTIDRFPECAVMIEWHGRADDDVAISILQQIGERFPLRIVQPEGDLREVDLESVVNPERGHVELWLER